MNLDGALELVRSRLDDLVEDYRWSDADLLSYFNRRRNDFARRTGYFRETNLAAISTLAIVSGTADYALDERIIEIKGVKASWSTKTLTKRTCRYMNEFQTGWQEASNSTPYIWLPDKQTGYLTLWPTPNAAGAVTLTVIRLPLAQLTLTDIGNGAALEVPLLWQEDLIDGVLASAYSKQDTDTYDPRKVAEHEAIWERFILTVIQHATKTYDIEDEPPDYYNIYGEAGF